MRTCNFETASRRRRCGYLDRKKAPAALFLAAALPALPAFAQPGPGRQADGSSILPTGQRITPSGTQVALRSLPMSLEVSRDGRHLLVLEAGYEPPSVSVIDLAARRLVQRLELPDAWLGLTLNRRGDKVYVGGGARGSVFELSFVEGRLQREREFPLLPGDAGGRPTLIGDVRFDPDDRLLYAADVPAGVVAVINTQSGLVLGDFKTGAAPYRMRLAPDGKHLLISHWAEASVGLYRLADRRLVERIPVGERPTDLIVAPGAVEVLDPQAPDDEARSYPARLLVACAYTDSVWSLGITAENRFELIQVVPVAPGPASPVGSLPTALGLGANGELYIVNSGNNSIVAADLSAALIAVVGALPTGWFPTAAAGLPDGGVAYLSGKGDTENGGLAGILPALNSEQIGYLTAAAVRNLPAAAEALPAVPGAVKHVVLIFTDARGAAWRRIRERFTYLAGFAAAGRDEWAQLAWLSSAHETDFFVKLGPAAAARRLPFEQLGAIPRAAAPAAGTLWSNAADAGLSTAVYGLSGGRSVEELLAAAAERPPTLTVVRLRGPAAEQDRRLGALLEAFERAAAFAETAVFAVPLAPRLKGAVVAGGPARRGAMIEKFVSTPSLVRSVEWLLGLNPLTQFDSAAPIVRGLFPTGAESAP